MRPEDVARLSKLYERGPDAPSLADQFARSLETELPQAETLRGEILADLDATTFGVRWWQGHLDTRRRILVSDQLLKSIEGVSTNILEARVHLLEARGAQTVWASQFEDASAQQNLPPGRVPRLAPTCPADDLSRVRVSLHEGGFFRAIGSALDCMGAVVVGVAAIPYRLLRADLKMARQQLPRFLSSLSGPSREAVETLEAGIAESISAAGPSGWDQWALDMRNMLVHRARRLQFPYTRLSAHILRADGTPLKRAQVSSLMPRDPGRSDVEVMAPPRRLEELVLHELSDTTMSGVLQSTLTALDAIAERLTDLWQRRRTNPELLRQPVKQWPKLPLGAQSEFRGYSPGQVDLHVDALTMHPDLGRRLQAAALFDADRGIWTRSTEEAVE